MQYLLTQEELDNLKKGFDERFKIYKKTMSENIYAVLRRHNVTMSMVHYNPELKSLIDDLTTALDIKEQQKP